jgi:Common central domain of tyrosinase/Polyphenol oxidase middle domain
MRIHSLLVITISLYLAGTGAAVAQQVQLVPAYPLYCQGPLTTGPLSGRETKTPFTWASAGAGATNPGSGQCAWADRAPRGTEILPGGGNVICDFSGAMQSVPIGTYVEIGVARDPQVNNCMHLFRYLGAVLPPFSGVSALAPFIRQSIANLTASQIASLQRGITAMMSRPATDPTSYQFQANIHGTYASPTTPEETQGWNQCEHGSFYFLSWHRMYLYFFDRILRAASGDPTLVLPYWNWTDPAQRNLPVAFRQPANSSNSLYIAPPGRPAALDAGTAFLGAGAVDYSIAFADTNFESPSGSGAAFGGQIAPPMQFDSPHSDFESQPHDVVHVALGGLMSDVDTAAEDPIFWLHHANIDRMWKRWLQQGNRSDPTDAIWLNTQFSFFDEAGHAVYLSGADIVETANQLNYQYDDDPAPMSRLTHEARKVEIGRAGTPLPRTTMVLTSKTQHIGLDGSLLRMRIPLTTGAITKLHEINARKAARALFLRFDDIRYEKSSGVYYEVYVDAPVQTAVSIHTPGYVGNLSLFGLNPHRVNGAPMPPHSDVFVEYNISRLVPRLIQLNLTAVNVTLVPRGLFDARGNPLPVSTKMQGMLTSVRLEFR